MNPARITAEFIGETGRRLFVLAHHPASNSKDAAARQCVLVCPPFAEEMNKSRRMLTELSRLLVAQGKVVVIPDLFGTGDSEGDFADATWQQWLADLHTVEQWLSARGWQVQALLGIRLGCLLATHYAATRTQPLQQTVFWQPLTDGARGLEQFLRLRVAAAMMSDAKETSADIKARFARGEVVEVAGYGVSAMLAQELATLKLTEQASQQLGHLHWFEVLRAADVPLAVPAAKAIEQIKLQLPVTLHTVVGEPFWATTEITCLPELLSASVAALTGDAHHA